MNSTTQILSALGGIFFLLSFCHFIVDWVFQTHKEAMSKATDHAVRFRHCCVYSFGMMPLIYLLLDSWVGIAFSFFVLFVSHFLIDTYIPVYLWVKYLRRPPAMEAKTEVTTRAAVTVKNPEKYLDWNAPADTKTNPVLAPVTDLVWFKAFASTPIGLFLAIAMDQAFHLLFLIPIAAIAVLPSSFWIVFIVTSVCICNLGTAVVIGAGKINAVSQD